MVKLIPILFTGLRSLVQSNPELGRTPLLTNRSISSQCTNELKSLGQENMLSIFKAIEFENPEVATLRDDLAKGKQVNVAVLISGTDGQSQESISEQVAALQLCKMLLKTMVTLLKLLNKVYSSVVHQDLEKLVLCKKLFCTTFARVSGSPSLPSHLRGLGSLVWSICTGYSASIPSSNNF